MKVVGLCGQSGAGKGLVCCFFEQLNVKCIDTDKVYHDIISENSNCTNELVAVFGSEISSGQGIDRKELRKIAFASADNLNCINHITHKHILSTVRSLISQIKNENVYDGIIVDAPLLFESGFDKECDCTVAIISDVDKKIRRIAARDNITENMAIKRVSSQIKDEELALKCTYVIENNSTPENLKEEVAKLKQILFE